MSDPTMHGSSGDWNKLKHLVDLSAENARLKAEVGELADALKLASEVGIKIADEVTRLKAEVERLRASSFVTAVPVEQYERLREAGDALAAWTLTLEHTYDHKPMDGLPFSSFLCVWHEAAKEGKQP